MNQQTQQDLKIFASTAIRWLSKAFDQTATWVTQLSWWKFFLFVTLMMTSGAILQDTFFQADDAASPPKKSTNKKTNQKNKPKLINEDTNIEIDSTGIRIKKPDEGSQGKRIEIDATGIRIAAESAPHVDADNAPASTIQDNSNIHENLPGITFGKNDIHIKLPKEVAQEIRNEIEKASADAAADAADEERATSKNKAGAWFMNFVLLLVFGLFGMKALMGGKVKAEEMAKEANAVAEKESLLRQISEAQIQMMQAQVEPHFLFNTLASVEYLIETDPPRAAAMQRSLIAYLRAVLPQMRESAPKTNLGREADIIKSYLELLKMRMEERLTIDFIMPEKLRTAAFPPMMLQSLVENAIKHGLEVKAEGGTLQFRAEIAQDKLRVSVKDDGLGFGAVASNGTGLGLQNIRERLQLIYKGEAQMIITPNQPTGVCVAIEIPYEQTK